MILEQRVIPSPDADEEEEDVPLAALVGSRSEAPHREPPRQRLERKRTADGPLFDSTEESASAARPQQEEHKPRYKLKRAKEASPLANGYRIDAIDEDVPLAALLRSAPEAPAAERKRKRLKRRSERAVVLKADPLAAGETGTSRKMKQEAPLAPDEDDVPLAMLAAAAVKRPASVKTSSKLRARPPAAKPKKGKRRRQRETPRTEQEAVSDGTIKWHTLSHHGVVFPPEYLPHHQPLLYDGEQVVLPAEVEEMATFYATKLGTPYVEKDTFRRNFFEDFRKAMTPELRSRIRDLRKCDFSRIQAHLERLKAEKQGLLPSQRKELRETEAARVAKYTVAMVDGREEKVGNFRVEPPGLFLGRGEHPLMGKVKRRIMPEDITLNLGRDAPVPECPVPGHRWGQIVHNKTVTWLAFWKDTITDGCKYVWLNAASHFKSVSDREKFEKAQELSRHISRIRTEYVRGLGSADRHARQRSVALYLIDKLALRVGNEKGEDEADTVGCCSLRVEHVRLTPPNRVDFDFLGKDSMRYQNSVQVDERAFRCLREFVAGRRPTDQIFDELRVDELNDYLKQLMPGLSAKVFRTYNASYTLDRLLSECNVSARDVHHRLLFYNEANRDVAILCNHQRTLPKTHDATMEKLREQLDDAKKYVAELKQALERSRAQGGGRVIVVQWRRPTAVIPPDTLPAEAQRLRREAALQPKQRHERSMGAESIQRAFAQTEEKIRKLKADIKTRTALATVSLSTSKINYLDPRITVAWCKRHEVPIEKIFPKTLQEKFRWSMDASEDFRFPLTMDIQEAV
eukprot:ctg_166.g94